MKIKTEVKLGIIAVVVIAVFVWGFNYMKGKNLMRTNFTYYVEYDNVNGLKSSDPVLINGHRIGMVESIELSKEKTGRLLVKFMVEEDIPFASNSIAEIHSVDIMGSQGIRILFGDGRESALSGDTLSGSVAAGLAEMMEPVRQKADDIMESMDSLLINLNKILSPEFRSNLDEIITELHRVAGEFANMIDNESSDLHKMLKNSREFSESLNESSDELAIIIDNMAEVSDSLANANIKSLINNLDKTTGQANIMLTKLNEGEGTAGQLLNNDSLYYYMEQLTKDMDALMVDMKENPNRYINVSVFGGKKSDKKN